MKRYSLLLILAVPVAAAAAEDSKLGRVAWSAFQCHQWAASSGSEADAERLFGVGLDAARRFIDGLKSGLIDREEANQFTPIGIGMVAQGPSTDFIVGRIYSFATEEAHDDLVKEREGLPQSTQNWITDPELIKTMALNKYQNANCDLIE
jgi:hypothetical protein